jgi:antitoxin VapB
MALNIKNVEVERLAAEVAALSGVSKTTAVLDALEERKARLLRVQARARAVEEVREFLEREVWSLPDSPGAISDDEVLGFGPAGV